MALPGGGFRQNAVSIERVGHGVSYSNHARWVPPGSAGPAFPYLLVGSHGFHFFRESFGFGPPREAELFKIAGALPFLSDVPSSVSPDAAGAWGTPEVS